MDTEERKSEGFEEVNRVFDGEALEATVKADFEDVGRGHLLTDDIEDFFLLNLAPHLRRSAWRAVLSYTCVEQ